MKILNHVQGIIRDEYSLFVPVIERIKDGKEFMADDHTELIKRGQYSKVPWLMGVNSGEGLLYTIRKSTTNFKNKNMIGLPIDPAIFNFICSYIF